MADSVPSRARPRGKQPREPLSSPAQTRAKEEIALSDPCTTRRERSSISKVPDPSPYAEASSHSVRPAIGRSYTRQPAVSTRCDSAGVSADETAGDQSYDGCPTADLRGLLGWGTGPSDFSRRDKVEAEVNRGALP